MTLSLSYVYMDIWVNDSFLPHLKEHLQFKTFFAHFFRSGLNHFFHLRLIFISYNVVTFPYLTIEMSKPRKFNVSLVTQYPPSRRFMYFY